MSGTKVADLETGLTVSNLYFLLSLFMS